MMSARLGVLLVLMSLHSQAQINPCAGIITDRPYYFVGDTIRGEAVVLKPCQQINHPLEVALQAPSGDPVLRQLIPFGETANFNFPLSGLREEGMYQLLISYPKATNEILYKQDLAVIQAEEDDISDVLPPASIEVYTKGKILNGRSQRLLVEVQDIDGYGVAVAGEIFDEKGQKVSEFETDALGLSEILFQSDSGHQYQLRLMDYPLQQDIPPGLNEGISVVAHAKSKGLSLNIKGQAGKEELKIKLTGSQGYKQEKSIFTNMDSTEVFFDYSRTPRGFLLLQIYGAQQDLIWKELLYYFPNKKELKVAFHQQQKMGAATHVMIDGIADGDNNFCTVIDKNQTPIIPYSPFQNPQWLQAISITNREENSYFRKLLTLWSHDNNILSKMFSETPVQLNTGYGGSLHGKLVNTKDEPQRFVPVLLSIPTGESELRYSVTSATGSFSFSGFLFEGDKTGFLYPMIEDKTRLNQLRITVQEDMKSKDEIGISFHRLKKTLSPWIMRRLLNSRIVEVFNPQQDTLAQASIGEKNQIVNVYGNPDHSVNMTDYVTFGSMREIIKEALSNVNFVKGNRIRVFSHELRRNYSGVPLMLVDGIPTLSDSVILNLDPANIDRVDVISSRRKLMSIGAISQYGLIAFYTKNGVDVNDMEGATKVVVSGYDIRYPNKTLTFPKRSIRVPDLAPVIYWDTHLMDGDFSFQVPNNLTHYGLILGSFTGDGFNILQKVVEVRP